MNMGSLPTLWAVKWSFSRGSELIFFFFKELFHVKLWYGFSPVWMCWCVLKLICCVNFPTLWTPIWLLSWVNKLMSFKMTISSKMFSTLWAVICLLSCVNALVYPEITQECETLSTLWAVIWLLPCVNVLMVFKSTFCKTCPTPCALIFFFSYVNPFVILEYLDMIFFPKQCEQLYPFALPWIWWWCYR